MISPLLPCVFGLASAAMQAAPLPEQPTLLRLPAPKPVLRTLHGGERHRYALDLQAGGCLRLVALQKGVDLVLRATAPDGKLLAEVDGPTGSFGAERLSLAVPTTGRYTFEVTPLEADSPKGEYELRVEAVLSPREAARIRTVDLPAAQIRAHLGTYEIAPGHRVMLTPIFGLSDKLGLLYTDLKSGEARLLHPRSATSFFGGPETQSDWPIALEVELTTQGLKAQWKGQGTRTARKLPCRQEEVTFRNGDVELSGTLILPEGPGPFPALVYAHGSGPLERDSPYGPAFYPQGVAYLCFDKRGTGRSTGAWRTASLEELASDVVAGVRTLQQRTDIRPDRIGVIGISQGGWVGSLAARSKEVSFLVVHSGSGVSVAENIVWEQLSQVKAAGLPPEQVAKAEPFFRTTGRMATEGRPWEEIHAAYEAVKQEPFAAFAFPAALPKENTNWEWFRKNGEFDSTQTLRQVTCPVLWFLGEFDTQVPAARSAPLLKAAFRAAGNPDATVRWMPRASHFLMVTRPDLHNRDLSRFVPGFWQELGSWVKVRAHRP